MIGIYKITSPSGKIYIGQAWNFKDRLRDYRCYDCKNQKVLYNSLKKYGFDNHKFEILKSFEDCPDNEFLDDWERLYIWEFKSNVNRYPSNNGMNLTDGGEGNKGMKHSEETKRKIGIANTGKRHSEESRKKQSDLYKTDITCQERVNKMVAANKGSKRTEVSKKKMSISQKGRIITIEARRKIGAANTGRKHSDESKRKIGASVNGERNGMYGKNHSDDSKKQIGEATIKRMQCKEMKLKIKKTKIKTRIRRIGFENTIFYHLILNQVA
jgi:group I intron endonuclease